MPHIAIVGAGEVGGAIAHTLARRDIVPSMCLIDDRERLAYGKALDIMQAAPVEGFATKVTASANLAQAVGAQLIVIADRAAGEWQGEDGLQLLDRLDKLAPGAPLLCAGATQRELVDVGVHELHINRQRLFGSAPEALAGAARAFVALAVDGSPRDVSLSIVGVPPSHAIVPWDDATVAGFRVTKLIDEPTRRQVEYRIKAAWPPGPYSLAAAAAKTVDAMFGRTRMIVSCFVGPEDGGRRARTAAMPVLLARGGVATVVLPALSVADRVALDNATLL